MRTIIFSRTADQLAEDHLELADDAVAVAGLMKVPGGNILIAGGGELGSSLLGAGLVHEVGLNVHPVIVGSGKPILSEGLPRTALTLEEARVLTNGCVVVRYRV